MQRILFAFFPTYRASPLRPPAARVLQIGDASGVQSPLSFGGFGAMTRHLARLTASTHEALQVWQAAAPLRCTVMHAHAHANWMLHAASGVQSPLSFGSFWRHDPPPGTLHSQHP